MDRINKIGAASNVSHTGGKKKGPEKTLPPADEIEKIDVQLLMSDSRFQAAVKLDNIQTDLEEFLKNPGDITKQISLVDNLGAELEKQGVEYPYEKAAAFVIGHHW
jgi:hypothetical protein